MQEQPIVSIICLVYNHEKYVSEAINGFIMQKTNFPVEVIIHDDASTDKSASIIKEFEKKHPKIIKPIYQNENQYSIEKGRVTKLCLDKAKGKYIALCEGDDYWTDPNKLQKQVDALEKNIQIDICSHSVTKYDEALEKYTGIAGNNGTEERVIPIEEVINKFGVISPMSSILIRNTKTKDFIQLISNGVYGGHGIMQVLWAHPNGIFYIPKTMSTYRVNSSGSITKNILNNKEYHLKVLIKRIESFRLLDVYFNLKYKDSFSYKILEVKKNILRTGKISIKEKINFLQKEKTDLTLIEIIMLIGRGLISKTKRILIK